jgi:hypothetical protein
VRFQAGDIGPVAVANVEDADELECLDRFADRAASGAKLRGELGLRREP